MKSDSVSSENDIEKLRCQIRQANNAILAIAEDGWLCCGPEGYDEAQQKIINYLEAYMPITLQLIR